MNPRDDDGAGHPAPSSDDSGAHGKRALFWIGVGLLLLAVFVPTVLDLASVWGFAGFFSRHQFFTTIATEALLIMAVYLFIERALEARQDNRWRAAAQPSLRDIRSIGGELRRSVHERLMDLPERHASHEEVDKARVGLTPRVDAFDRVLATNRPMLTASPALVEYLLAAETMRVDSRQFLDDLNYGRGGARTSEWFEESCRVLGQTCERFERAYSDVPDTSGYVRRLRFP